MTTEAIGYLVTCVVSIIGGLTIEHIRIRGRQAELERSLLLLQKENTTLQARVTQLEAENTELKQQITKQQGRAAILGKYEFIKNTGTFLEKTSNLHFCPTCLQKKDTTESPMQDTGNGWHCYTCNQDFDDPQRPVNIDYEKLARDFNSRRR